MKMRELKNLIVLMVFAFLGVATVMAATLSGKAVDSASGEPLIQASVRILAAADSALVKGSVTSESGRFKIEGLKKGKYIVEVSYVGFATQTMEVSLSADQNLALPEFKMAESSILLKDAVITGIRTPVKVMEDTIEFNAESYKTQPNAVVEDLLKRLPGVEVGSDGAITANGQSVTKILIDGKEFFSDDPKVASRNLPVEMVEKLQVVNRKSDLARMTGVDDGEEETVINLTVKKEMNNGWFGNIEGGYATDDRYKGSFIVNRFWNGNQITVLGGANNINQSPVTDGAAGRFRRFGGSNGINSAQAFGVNFNVGKEEIFRVGGNIMYSHNDRNTRTTSEREYLLPDNTSITRSNSRNNDKGHNFRADFRVQWKPDSFNTFEFRPNISLNYNNSTSTDSTLTYASRGVDDMITRSLNNATSDGRSFEFGGQLIFNHNFKQRKGRSFSVFANYRLSNVHENANTYSYNRFYLLDSLDVYDQYADNHTWSNQFSTRLTWTEPLGDVKKGNFLTVAYNFSYRWNNADKLTYDRPVEYDPNDPYLAIVGQDLIFNSDLSNMFRNNYMNQDIRIGYRHVTKTVNLNAGISIVPQMSESKNLINDAKSIPKRNVLNYAPFLRYRYKLNKNRSLTIDYNGRSSQPSLTQLQPVADMSDPLRIVIGNPELNPTFSHNLRFRFQDYNPDAMRSIMTMVNARLVQNSIVSMTSFNNETGGQITEYTNVNGVWNVDAMNVFSMPFRNRAFTFNNHLGLNYSHNVGFSNRARNESGSFNINESFGISWSPEYIQFELRPRYSFQTVHNTVQSASNRNVHTYGASFFGTYNSPFGLVLSSDLNYSATSGYSNGYDTKTWMWNASIAYQFLRGRKATITLRAYDLLGQRSNISRSVTANYIQDARYNSLTRYVMVSVSYKFNTMADKARSDRRGEMDGFDGPPEGGPRGGHGGPGGGGPGGPPPGGGFGGPR